MVKLFVFVCLLSVINFTAFSQTVIYINAGSRATYGNYQDLRVNANGESIYKLKEVNGRTRDSLRFTLSKNQLDSVLAKADQVGFFQLNNQYDGGRVDGAGIMIGINNSGRKKTVQLQNTDVPQINQLVAYINRILETQKIRIYYGQK